MYSTVMPHTASWLQQIAARRPGHIITVFGQRQTTADLACRRVAALSEALRADAVKSGDRIVLLSSNSDTFLEALLAVLSVGAIAVPLNTRWTRQEVRAAIVLCGPVLLLCESTLLQLVNFSDTEQTRKIPPILLLGQRSKVAQLLNCTDELAAAHMGAQLWLQRSSDDAALIVFTSGTTGAAKGVCLTHQALSFQANAKVEGHGYNCKDVYLHTAPLCHVGGLVSWLAMLQAGATHVLMPKYSPEKLLSLAREHRVTAMIAVPAVVQDLLAQPQEGQLPCVKKLLLGGGHLHPALHPSLRALLPNADIWTAYGMTECTSSITTALLEAMQQAEGGVLVGKPPAGIEVAIKVQTEAPALQGGTGASCTSSWEAVPGTLGEVVSRGPHLMAGYWNDPKATEAAFLPGRWFRTGDLGRLDGSGNLWLSGRIKDVVRSGSENVSAGEVESVLQRHPGIAAAAVVGLPHSRLGEQVAALLQLKSGYVWEQQGSGEEVLTMTLLARFCRNEGLASFKVPRVTHGQGELLPVNSSGKVLKQVVKQRLLELQKQHRPTSRM